MKAAHDKAMFQAAERHAKQADERLAVHEQELQTAKTKHALEIERLMQESVREKERAVRDVAHRFDDEPGAQRDVRESRSETRALDARSRVL